MKIFAAFLIVFASILSAFGQTSRNHTVYFNSDEAMVLPAEKNKLAEFFSKIANDNVDKIEISGHTDHDGSKAYNLNLSKLRVEAVREELAKLDISNMKSSELFFGEENPIEENKSSNGKRLNRRVEIKVTLRPEPTEVEEPIRITNPFIFCDYDTTLIFPQGTEVTMNLCDYYSIKDCFQFIEYNTGESIRNSDLTTQTADGIPLISGGMFEVKMCKDVEISVAIPQIQNPCDTSADFKLWTATDQGAWAPMKGTIQRFRRGGRNFLRTVVEGTTKINLDALPSPSAPIPKTIVKVPMGFKIISKVKLSTDIPASLFYAYDVKKRKAKFKSICPCSEPLLYLEVQNRDGDTIKIDFENLNDFDSHEAFGECRGEDVVKRILFFKVREKRMYRKYLIRKKSLNVKNK